jgi:hypothetical protein
MRKYILGTLLTAMSFAANAQFNLGMHQFTGVPQSTYTNPGLLPQSRFFIALPSVYVNYWNPTFVLDDIIKEVGDKSMLDFSKLYNEKPGGTFGFNIEQQAELFHLGFRIKKKNFISLGVYQGLQTGIRLPVDLLRLVQEGTTSTYFQDNPISLDNIDINIQSYVAYHLGFGREINEKLSVGGRVKFINGLIATNTEYARGKIYWDSDSVRVTSDLRYNTAGFARLDQSLGIFGSDSVKSLAPRVLNVNEWVPSSGNTGLAFDFGFTYKPIEKLVLSFSATDLGSINWTQSLRSYVSEENEFTYRGGQITVGEEDGAGPFDGITDSLLSGLNIQEAAGKAFTTRMNSRYIISASYELLPNTFVGGIYSRNRYFNESFDAFTAFAQFKIWNVLFLRGNYTIAAGAFDNLGGALAIKLGPLQVYTVADNLLALSNQGNVSSFNVRVGANLVFGMRKPKGKKDALTDL